MELEPNDWRPYGKIVYQKQNFIVKQVAMLPEKAAEYDSAPDYACCPIQSWKHTFLFMFFDDWRMNFAMSREIGIVMVIP